MENKRIIGMNAANAEYGIEDAVIPLDDLLAVLQDAKAEGATHIVGYTGNYRGAKYAKFATTYDFLDDEDEDY